ncbi:hypothetical protein CDIK_1215 [Cucumispora dikerogammari]|nr:hypothetical protein CDIK_1215 [Cucumispora dikerogammari]
MNKYTIPFKEFISFKTFNPNKLDKQSIKIYICSYSLLSYIYGIKVCSISSNIEQFVFNLFEGLYRNWHNLFMNNFYNSFDLCYALKIEQFNVCVTLRIDKGP